MDRVTIRPLVSNEDLRACERIQEVVWGNVGVSGEVMKVTQKYGGAVIGSIIGGKVVSFIYAFLARRHGKLIHWSHLMAVAPKLRDLGLGFRMKLAHRKLALDAGIASICWTYDPLQSRNAALNIGRLGGRADEYVANLYGRFPSAIERGLESDRLVVNWRIRSATVKRRLLGQRLSQRERALILKAPRINETRLNAQGFIENYRTSLQLREATLLLEIPSDTDRMRAHALPLARRWRAQTRKMFVRYFERGYRAEGFIPTSPVSGGACFYVLRRGRKGAS